MPIQTFEEMLILQVPLFIYWIVAVRQMAMAAHPGFESVIIFAPDILYLQSECSFWLLLILNV